ncbi:DUF1501 domain-containing protein [Lignipirellula cremea]|uniref:DUF1501 domain-containing protein n=1 Tax=Lignipirellula cremea TaxID=2528010 RepID=A0A518DUN3_9BACT|nr:DUF1501 domain-containing protein [Lignipirellula cremea]QDU95534.1 hypothetical protein Pla8534_33490 [Lignipirellula cremea]
MSRTPRSKFCGSPEHAVSRRSFLGAAAGAAALTTADMTVLDSLTQPAMADELKRQGKHVILLWLAGGASQLETWDPKPGRPTGGPYRAIPTSTPGVHISELMPKMAQRLQNTAIIRSLNTGNGSHGDAARIMHLGRRDEASIKYPDLGAVVARELGQADAKSPDYVAFYTATEGRGNAYGQAGFLGARYLPMFLTKGNTPENLSALEGLSDIDHKERAALRELLSSRFVQGRSGESLGSHNEAYARVRGLMSSETLFDVSQESDAMRDKYGRTLFGEQMLIARRLVEAGTPFVKVSRAWWDSHGQNFETHLELVSELDHVMACLLDDLDDRGLLQDTLVVTLSEFGRTPTINGSLGRDHFAKAWSASLSGCGVNGGSVYGETDEDGQTVKDGEIGAGDLFATIYEALGINHRKDYYVGSRPLPLTNPGTAPVKEVLA